jgi:hypothetical protein
LATRCCHKPKERTWRNYGYRKRLAVTGRKMTCHPGVPWFERNIIRRKWTKDKIEQGIGDYGPSGRDCRHARKAEWE